MIKLLQKFSVVIFLMIRWLFRLVVWPAGAVWSYFTDTRAPRAPKDLQDANRPIFLDGKNGKGVLLFHGWTSTPYEMRALAKRLNEKGYTVSAPLLSGHGTIPKNLEDVTHEDWIIDAQHHYDDLKVKCKSVSVGGMSMGGSLALIMAERNDDVASVIALGTPYIFRRQRFGIVMFRFIKILKKYENKRYPVFGTKPQITNLVSYQKYPIDSALEVFCIVRIARKNLSKIIQPILIIQSAHDHLIARSSIFDIYIRVRSNVKKKKLLFGAYHNFIADIQHSHIYDDIADFLDKHA